MKTKYDYVIYGATLQGVYYAQHLTKQGKSVLLTNFYGFAGGSITESLALKQIMDDYKKDSFSYGIYKELKNSPNGILFEKDDYIIADPETLKTILQKIIEDCNIDVLFYVNPFKINTENNKAVSLDLIAREGIINIKADQFVDASEDYRLLGVAGTEIQKMDAVLCGVITNTIENPEILNNSVKQQIVLKDKRVWFSTEVKYEDIKFVEAQVQKVADGISDIVSPARIQMMPAEVYINCDINPEQKIENVTHIAIIINETFDQESQFVAAFSLEEFINKNEE